VTSEEKGENNRSKVLARVCNSNKRVERRRRRGQKEAEATGKKSTKEKRVKK